MKRSRLKLPKKGKEPPDSRHQQTMEYSEAVSKDIWASERSAADAILKQCRQLKLPVKLDKLTQGVGNCFMVAVLQQLRRNEIHSNLGDDLKQMANDLDQMKLRRFVVDFIRQRKDHPQVIYMKERFAPDLEVFNGPKSWEEYWERMLLDCNWADGDFVQATAWYLNCDLWIIDTSCTKQLPFIKVCGNMDVEDSSPEIVDPLLIGCTTGIHFQSLLFDWDSIKENNLKSQHSSVQQHLKRKLKSSLDSDEPPSKTKKQVIKTLVPSNNKCPNCNKEFQQLLRHIKQSKCNKLLDPEFIKQVKILSDEKTRLKNQKRSAEFRNKKQTDDHEALKRQNNETVAAHRVRKRKQDHEEMKNKNNQTVSAYREKKRKQDHEEMKKKHNQTVSAYRERKRKHDNEPLKLQQKK